MPAANQARFPALRIRSTGLTHAVGASESRSWISKSPSGASGTPVVGVLCALNVMGVVLSAHSSVTKTLAPALKPMLSPPAMQEGRYVARAIRHGAVPQEPFRYRDKGTMATIGRRAAVAQVGPVRLRGVLGWITWLVVHLYYLIGFRNRAVVLASWGWDYVRRDRPIRLIVRSSYDPVAASLVPED